MLIISDVADIFMLEGEKKQIQRQKGEITFGFSKIKPNDG